MEPMQKQHTYNSLVPRLSGLLSPLISHKLSGAQQKEAATQAKADQLSIKTFKKELRYKEKALAETAALLVLRKKLDAFWEQDNEDN